MTLPSTAPGNPPQRRAPRPEPPEPRAPTRVCGHSDEEPRWRDGPGPALGSELQPVEVRYEHSQGLPALLEQLELSLLLSTYQAGRVVSVGSHRGELRLGFSRFDQAMGLCRTPSGIAVGTTDGIWSLPANREIAPHLQPEGEHDIAFLARSCYHSGPLMGHDLAWCGGQRRDSPCHLPSREVRVGNGVHNLRFRLDDGWMREDVILALARLSSFLEKGPDCSRPRPAPSG
jgi:hypothetical protein